jgi:intracellular sulfur oxidation DsrE/DsrF family protein
MKTVVKKLVLIASLCTLLPMMSASADDDSFAPGGTAIDRHTERFYNLKIIMDLKAKDIDAVKYATMVVSRIIEHPGTNLVVIIEGPFVSVFAKKNYLDHQGIVDQWTEFAKNGVHVEFCGNSVQSAGLTPADMEGLSEKNAAVVNSGAYTSIAHYETLGYKLVVPILMPSPAK